MVNRLSTNDYVKFVTQQIVSYIDKPKEERRLTKEQRRFEHSPLVNRWFGLIPFAFMILFKKKRR